MGVIDYNLAFKQIAPSYFDSARKGIELGNTIRNAPILRKLNEQRAELNEQNAALNEQKLTEGNINTGESEAMAIFRLTGNKPITPENYLANVQSFKRAGLPVQQQDLEVTPENIAAFEQLRQYGQNVSNAKSLTKTGGARRVFETDVFLRDEDGNIFTQQTFSDPNSQTSKVELIDVTGQGLSPKGKLSVVDRGTGETITESRTRDKDVNVQENTEKKKWDAAIKAGEETAAQISTIDNSIRVYDEALAALDAGARTGAVQKYLPSVQNASLELDNARNNLGLSIIQATTFGSLSEAEMEFALSTAIPTGMDEEGLKDFLRRKKEYQMKAREALAEAARQFSQGKTRADLIAKELDKTNTGNQELDAKKKRLEELRAMQDG